MHFTAQQSLEIALKYDKTMMSKRFKNLTSEWNQKHNRESTKGYSRWKVE